MKAAVWAKLDQHESLPAATSIAEVSSLFRPFPPARTARKTHAFGTGLLHSALFSIGRCCDPVRV